MDELDKSGKSCAIKVYLSNLTKRKSHVTLVIPEILTGTQIKKLALRKIGMNEQQLTTELLLLNKEQNYRSCNSINYEDINDESVKNMYHVLDTDCPSHFIPLKSCEFHLYGKDHVHQKLKRIPHISQVNSRINMKDRLSSVLNTEVCLERLPGYRSTRSSNTSATSSAAARHSDNVNNHISTNGLSKNTIPNNNNHSKIKTSIDSHNPQNSKHSSSKNKNIDSGCFVEYDSNSIDLQNSVIEKVKLRNRPSRPTDEITCRPPLSSVRNSLLLTKNEFSKLEADVANSKGKLPNDETSGSNFHGVVPVCTQDKTNANIHSPSSSYSSSSMEMKIPLNSSMPSLVKQKSTRTTRLSVKKQSKLLRNDEMTVSSSNISSANNTNTAVNNLNNYRRLNSLEKTKPAKPNSTSSDNNSTMSSIDLNSERQQLSLNDNFAQKPRNYTNDKSSSRRLLPQVAFPEEIVEEKRYLLSKKLEQRLIRRVSNRDVNGPRRAKPIRNTTSPSTQPQKPVDHDDADFDCKSITSQEVATIMADAGPMGVTESDYEEQKTSDAACEEDEDVDGDAEDLFASKRNRFPSLFDLMKNHLMEESDGEDLNEGILSNNTSIKSHLNNNSVNNNSNNSSFVKATGFVPYFKNHSTDQTSIAPSLTLPSKSSTSTSKTTNTATLPSITSTTAVHAATSKRFLSLFDILNSKCYQLLTIRQHIDCKNNEIILPFEILNTTVALITDNNKEVIYSTCVVGPIECDTIKNDNDNNNKVNKSNKTFAKSQSKINKENTLSSVNGDHFTLQENDIIVEINGKHALMTDAHKLQEELLLPTSTSSSSYKHSTDVLLKLVVARRHTKC